jgi:hypothetical protein
MPAVQYPNVPLLDLVSRADSPAQVTETISAFQVTPTASSLSLLRHAFSGLGAVGQNSAAEKPVEPDAPSSLPDRPWNRSVDEIWSYDAVGGSVFEVEPCRLSPYRAFGGNHVL